VSIQVPTARGGGVRGLAARHPHAVAAALALLVLGAVVLGPGVWSALRDSGTDGRWELQAGSHGVTAGLVIEVDGREVVGQGPCNEFRADWSPDHGASSLMSTTMGCAADVEGQETTFFDLLAAESVEVEGDRLRLASGDQALVFVQAG
jgi:hypothetical protein